MGIVVVVKGPVGSREMMIRKEMVEIGCRR